MKFQTALGTVAVAAVLVGCAEQPTAPAEHTAQPDDAPAAVRITTSTTGLNLDPDGYSVMVDGRSGGDIGANDNKVIQLQAGSREISLTGLAPNCQLQGPSSRTLTLVAGNVVLVEFVLICIDTRPLPDTTRPLPDTGPLLAFDRNGQIYVAHIEGSYLRQLTTDGYNREAAWSPDGRRIAFTKPEGGYGAAIYVIDADGANQKRLTPEGTYSASPTWSPDGSRIAFETRRDSTGCGLSCWLDTEIYVMNADGTNPVRLSNRPEHHDITPAWSPDGNRIAFVSDTFGQQNIYVMNADGSHRVNLTPDGQYAGNPAWSPDGSRLVFTRLYGVLHVMNADGTNLVPLIPTGSESRGWTQPAWSPDGLMIAATRRTDCHTDSYGDPVCHIGIYVLRIADGTMSELPLGVGSEWNPSWRP